MTSSVAHRGNGNDEEGWQLMFAADLDMNPDMNPDMNTDINTGADTGAEQHHPTEVRLSLSADSENPPAEPRSLVELYSRAAEQAPAAATPRWLWGAEPVRLLPLGPDERIASRTGAHVHQEVEKTSVCRAGQVVMAAVRAQVDELRVQDPHVRREVPGSVTLMRVATRQLRSTLTGFTRILDAEQTRPVAEELKWLGAQLADEHDTEVMIERFTEAVHALPENLVLGPVESDLERGLGQLAQEGEQTIHAALDSDRYLALQDMLDELVERPPLTHRASEPALTELPKSVAKAFKKLERRLDEASVLQPGPELDNALHEARKADKRVRYMSEIVAPLVGRPAKRLRRQAKKLQNLLGDYQDAVMARPVLRQLGCEAHSHGHNAFTYDLLDVLESARMERVLRELPSRLEHLRDEKTVAWLHQGRSGKSGKHHAPRPNWAVAS
jgi:CHAD domain-containing protein